MPDSSSGQTAIFPKKPPIYYIDDEVNNLIIFEALLSDKYTVRTFTDPEKAFEAMTQLAPWVILSDQRMAQMTGVKFLERAQTLAPSAIRIIVTGYSDEGLVIDSVRTAKVFDYLKKPWQKGELENSIAKACAYYFANFKNSLLTSQIMQRNLLLEDLTTDLRKTQKNENRLKQELKSWIPPFIISMIESREPVQLPQRARLVTIAYDIINSMALHGREVHGRSIRSYIMRVFTEIIMKYGGWRESHSGDSCFGHFGLIPNDGNLCELALATAREFRAALRGMSDVYGIPVECGIALHISDDTLIDIHTATLMTQTEAKTQKSFDSSSIDIDILHHMEKLMHKLPGTNIVMSEQFHLGLQRPRNFTDLGRWQISNLGREVKLYCLLSEHTIENNVLELLQRNGPETAKVRKVA